VSRFTSTKTYRDFPCSHRQWRHDGHCRFLHGYSRSFHFVFQADSLTAEGFVMDFSKLKSVEGFLKDMFDHTTLLNSDDPILENEAFMSLTEGVDKAIDLRIMPNVGMEGTAHFVYLWVNEYLQRVTNGRVSVLSVEVRENQKNSATYHGDGNAD